MLAVLALLIVATWAACAVVLIGIGTAALQPFRQEYFLTDAFWTGLGISVAILEIYHLLRAVDFAIVLALACLGLAGIILNRNRLSRLAGNAWHIGFWPLAIFGVLVVSLALHALGPCTHYDTGLYGAPAVRWIITYPAVPGLAALHDRLGFNSTVFLCIGALDRGIWRDQSYRLFSGLTTGALVASLLPAYVRLFRGVSTSVADWFKAILLIPAGVWIIRGSVVGTNTDLPATAAALAGFAILFCEIGGTTPADGAGKSTVRSVAAAALFALATTFKMSLVVLSFLGWIVLFVSLWRSVADRRERRLLGAGCVALPAAILVPWAGLSVILSGYPFYPSTLFPTSAGWRVPATVARAAAIWVRSWARVRHASLAETQGLGWVRLWLPGVLKDREGFDIPIILFVCGALVVLALVVRKRKPSQPLRALWILLPSVAGALFWIVNAPDPRFGEAALWVSAATCAALGAAFLLNGKGVKSQRIALVALLALTWWCATVSSLWLSYEPLAGVRELDPLPKTELVERQTLSGVELYQPRTGDQCWDAPLPCTPYFHETLQLRQPNNLRAGFVLPTGIALDDVEMSDSAVRGQR